MESGLRRRTLARRLTRRNPNIILRSRRIGRRCTSGGRGKSTQSTWTPYPYCTTRSRGYAPKNKRRSKLLHLPKPNRPRRRSRTWQIYAINVDSVPVLHDAIERVRPEKQAAQQASTSSQTESPTSTISDLAAFFAGK